MVSTHPRDGVLDMAGGDDIINIYRYNAGFLIGVEIEGTVLMGEGDDRLYSDAGISTNIQVWGPLDMGRGNDTIETLTDDRRNSGLSIRPGGSVFLGEGDDSLICTRPTNACTAIRHTAISGLLDAGDGNEIITGDQLQVQIGGNLIMGAGDDLIPAELYGSNNSKIDFGEGTDTLGLIPGDYLVAYNGDGYLKLAKYFSGAGYLISGLELAGPQGTSDVIPFQVDSFSIF
jgi:hypothetical protein